MLQFIDNYGGKFQDFLLVTGVEAWADVLHCLVVAPRVELDAGGVGTGLGDGSRR